jgi:predicted outer membrane repeat protein
MEHRVPILQDALSFANPPANGVTEVRIAQGVYKPDRSESNPAGTGDRSASFQIGSIMLSGGYAGLGAADPDARSAPQFESILSGDLAGNDQANFTNSGENSLHVVTITENTTAVLDGLTVVGGYADAPWEHMSYSIDSHGGGLLIDHSDVELSNCTLERNFASYSGGALDARASAVTIQHCMLRENMARTGSAVRGGPLYVRYSIFQNNRATAPYYSSAGAVTGWVTVEDSDFQGNTSEGRGGAFDGRGQLLRCRFVENSSLWGGAVFVADGAEIALDTCEFRSNSAGSGGGAIYVQGSDPTIQNCHFESNSAQFSGGAISCAAKPEDYNEFVRCRPTIINCTFLRNTSQSGGAMANRGSEPTVIGCRFRSNVASIRGGAISNVAAGNSYDLLNLDGDPQRGLIFAYLPSRPVFYNCILSNNATVKGGAIYNNDSTVTLVNCTLALNRAVLGGVFSHASATLRLYNSIVRNNLGGSFRGPGPRAVRYSDISGGHRGRGNVNKTVWFVNSGAGDFRLRDNSPCIDAGRNLYLPSFIQTDIAGKPRFRDDPATPNTGIGSPPVDMGAYEH